MFREIDELQSFFFTVERVYLDREDEAIKDVQEVSNALISLDLFGISNEFFPEGLGLFSFRNFFNIRPVFISISQFFALFLEDKYFLQDIQDTQDVLNMFIEHI